MARLPPRPSLSFGPDGVPRAMDVDDVYFSTADGLAEANAVFLAGCGLPAAWRGRDHFVIAELGFGTGLNVLATWALWRRTRQPGARLHMISVEAAPMAAEEAARAHARWPEVSGLSARLLACWPVRARGWRRLWFPDDGFCLTLALDDAASTLAAMDGPPVDAWFLDGFAPAKNPTMWSGAVFAELARLSAPGARLATYTVAGAVRRGLTAAGFAVEKRPGFGGKRERLEARYEGAAQARADPYPARPAARRASALIVGGGIAGAAMADAFARRRVACTILDADPCGRTKASNNPAALVMPRLDRGDTPAAEVFKAAYLAALERYRTLDGFSPIGVEELDADAARRADFAGDPPLPDDLLTVGPAGLTHHGAGVIAPAAVIEALCAGAVRLPVAAARLEAADGRWRALAGDGAVVAEADLAVIAAGPRLDAFTQTDWLPLTRTRGQISLAPCAGPALGVAIAAGAYALPFGDDTCFGATHEPVDADDEAGAPTHAAHAANHAALARLAPDLAARIDMARVWGRVSLRAAAPDRLPIAGPVPDAAAYRATFGPAFARGARLPAGAAPQIDGLFVLGGLGGRGFVTAFLCAEVVASAAFGEPAPLGRRAWEALQPARFLIRGLKRRA